MQSHYLHSILEGINNQLSLICSAVLVNHGSPEQQAKEDSGVDTCFWLLCADEAQLPRWGVSIVLFQAWVVHFGIASASTGLFLD